MINIVITCDTCGNSSIAHHVTKADAINTWILEGGTYGVYTENAQCPECVSQFARQQHPSSQKGRTR